MTAYVITEGPSDVELLRDVLPRELLDKVEFVPAGSLSRINSLARSLLAVRRTPVAVVIDADSWDPEVAQERRQSAEEAIGSVAGSVLSKVIVAVPALDGVLFQDTTILERVFGHPTPDEILSIARINPRDALEQLFARSKTVRNRPEVVKRLTPQDTQVLQKAAVVQELIQFLRHAQELSLVRTAGAAQA